MKPLTTSVSRLNEAGGCAPDLCHCLRLRIESDRLCCFACCTRLLQVAVRPLDPVAPGCVCCWWLVGFLCRDACDTPALQTGSAPGLMTVRAGCVLCETAQRELRLAARACFAWFVLAHVFSSFGSGRGCSPSNNPNTSQYLRLRTTSPSRQLLYSHK